MAVDSKKYLAENVLNERRTVTYRSLSRALKVHSHAAKRMLYEFYQNENSKKPNSVNATYVITGVQQPPEPPATSGDANDSDGDGDDVMQSSPYISSSMPNQDEVADSIATTSIILVREEDLEDAKSTFQSVASIHIYSLGPTVLQDLNVLTDVSREMLAAYTHEDPLDYGKQWGMIQNKNVKRRTGARPPPPPASTGPSTTASSKAAVPAKRPLQKDPPPQSKTETPKPDEATDSKQPPQKETGHPPSKPAGKTAPLKKEKSNLFSSFAKAKPKQKKEESETPAAKSADSSGAEDVNLGDASEEEPEELFANTGKPASTSNRESRREREDRLKKMMEDDEEEETKDDADQEMPDVEEPEEEPEEPREPEESAPIEQPPPPPKKQELKEEVTVQGGRRRGKRQVMKKKTVKDDEGYLVTVEEPTWESFSEDEPAAPPPKKKPAVSAAPKGKSGAKPGQGNIMSFFGKK